MRRAERKALKHHRGPAGVLIPPTINPRTLCRKHLIEPAPQLSLVSCTASRSVETLRGNLVARLDPMLKSPSIQCNQFDSGGATALNFSEAWRSTWKVRNLWPKSIATWYSEVCLMVLEGEIYVCNAVVFALANSCNDTIDIWVALPPADIRCTFFDRRLCVAPSLLKGKPCSTLKGCTRATCPLH